MGTVRTFAPLLIFLGAALLEGLHAWIGYRISGGFVSGLTLRGQPLSLLEIYARVLPSWLWVGLLAMAVVALTRRFPLTPGRWRAAVLVHLTGAIVFSTLAVLGNTTLRWAFFTQPEVGARWIEMVVRYYALYYNTFFIDYWGIVGVYSSFLFYQGMREREVTAERLARGLSEARLAALQHQLQPHFLFNTLNAISALAGARDYTGTVRAIRLLSDLLRMSIGNTGQISTLTEELRFAERYLELQRLRFPDRLQVRLDADLDLMAAETPGLLLQPLIENAVRYGIAGNPQPGNVKIEITRAGTRIRAVVRNSLPCTGASAQNGTGIGLTNVQARLAQLYREDFHFEIAATDREWTVTVEWPLRLRVRVTRDRAIVTAV
jgi:two-component system, LytTR family, sensor kinase